MKARKIGMFAGTVGAMLLSAQAMATFVPPAGAIQLKLTDGSGFYTDTTPQGRGPLFLGPGQVALPQAALDTLDGSRDFTAFLITSMSVNGVQTALPSNITGIATFLKVGTVDRVDDQFVRVNIADDSARGSNTPATPTAGQIALGQTTIGRFFLFQNESAGASAGRFGISGGLNTDVQFTTGGTTISSNGTDFFHTDVLPNFTDGAVFGDAVTTSDLLLTGSFVTDIGKSTLSDRLFPDPDAQAGVAWQGGILGHTLDIDGGLWFDQGVIGNNTATFAINQVGFDGSTNPTQAPFAAGLGPKGDTDVYAGGWQVSSQDPIKFDIIAPSGVPEPVTAGLGTMGLLALAGYITRRRTA